MNIIVLTIIHSLSAACAKAGVDPALAESYAWQLLEAVTKCSRTQLMSCDALSLSQDQNGWLDQAIHRLSMQEPLQYIIGNVQFLSCTINVKSPVLIPRSETEEWVAELIAYYNKGHVVPHTILDIGTGTGCIALSLAKAFSQSFVVGVDSNTHALELSRENAHLNHIANIKFVHSDVYAHVPAEMLFDIIVSNPPYVPEARWIELDATVTGWEDKNAIVAQDDGLAIIKRIIEGAIMRLSVQGALWIEIDAHQGVLVQELFYNAGFRNVCLMQDVQGRDRVVWGQKV